MNPTVISSTTTRGYTLRLEMAEVTSIPQNTSTISWELKLYSGGTYYFSGFRCGWEVYIGDMDTPVSQQARSTAPQISIGRNSSVVIASGTTVIAHNTDGTKTISVKASDDIATSTSSGSVVTAGVQTLEGSVVLENIPRQSSLTIPTLNIGTTVSFAITRAVNTYTHKLEYSFKGQTGVIGSNVATAATWAIPNAFFTLLPTAVAGAGTLKLTTYSGTTEIGAETYDVSFVVPDTIVPTASVTVTAVNADALEDYARFVKGLTKARIQTTATASAGATIAGINISVDEQTGTGADWTSDVFSAGDKTATITVRDSRGRTAVLAKAFTVQPYALPIIAEMTAERGTYSGGVWTANSDGAHIAVTVNATASVLADFDNSLIVYCGYDSSSTQSLTGGAVTFYYTDTSAESVYDFTAYAVDAVGSQGNPMTISVSTTDVSLFWNFDRIGIGKVAQEAKALEVAYEATFEKSVAIGGVVLPNGGDPDLTLANKVLKTNANGNGLEWGTGGGGIPYGVCNIPATIAAKTVTVDGAVLEAGQAILVKFTAANTAASPTLNVNGLGAKPIVRYGTTASAAYDWIAGETILFVYDGTSWMMVHHSIATTTYYGVTKLSSATNSTSTALAATPSAVKSAYDLAAGAVPKAGSMVQIFSGTHTTNAEVANWSSFSSYTAYLIVGKCGTNEPVNSVTIPAEMFASGTAYSSSMTSWCISSDAGYTSITPWHNGETGHLYKRGGSSGANILAIYGLY